MSRVWNALERFGLFWYDFVIGDDWTIAAGVVVALAATYGLLQISAVPGWWLLPVASVVVVVTSIWRANRRSE